MTEVRRADGRIETLKRLRPDGARGRRGGHRHDADAGGIGQDLSRVVIPPVTCLSRAASTRLRNPRAEMIRSDDRPFHRAQLLARQSRSAPPSTRTRRLSRAGISERLFALAFSGLVYPQIWEDPEVDMEAMQLGRRPSRRHHRVGRLQHPRLSHPLAGRDRRRRPQRGAHRAEPHEARGGPASALACRPVPLLRRGRQPPQQRGLRPLHRAQSRRRVAAATGRSAAGAASAASPSSSSNFYRTGLLGLFIGDRPSSPPGSTASIRPTS